MSTLVNIMLTLVAVVLSIAGFHGEVPTTAQRDSTECEYMAHHTDHLIINNEQLSQ